MAAVRQLFVLQIRKSSKPSFSRMKAHLYIEIFQITTVEYDSWFEKGFRGSAASRLGSTSEEPAFVIQKFGNAAWISKHIEH